MYGYMYHGWCAIMKVSVCPYCTFLNNTTRWSWWKSCRTGFFTISVPVVSIRHKIRDYRLYRQEKIKIIKRYQNISRIQIAKRVKRRNRRNDETSRVGPCNSAPLHWHSPMHVELPLSNACPAAVKTNENLGKTETHAKTLIVWHVWADAEVNQYFLCKNSTHVLPISVWLSSKAMQTLFLHVKGRGKPTNELFFDIALASFKPGKASAALAGSELPYLSLCHRALAFNAEAAWPNPSQLSTRHIVQLKPQALPPSFQAPSMVTNEALALRFRQMPSLLQSCLLAVESTWVNPNTASLSISIQKQSPSARSWSIAPSSEYESISVP